MLKRLKFGVQFYSNDGTKGFGCTRDITFGLGLTAITGLNGHGKSLVLEMIQFAYWGIAALRGVADDYEEAWLEHECWIKGKPYTIHRTISKATLFEGHDIDVKTAKKLAAGTKAVNQAIKELFGYSMPVFQVANAVNQKQVDQFCALLPTARKKLVDETIGLSALDTLVKWIAEQESSLRTQISTRAEMLREPVAPMKPEHYKPSAEITADLAVLNDTRRRRDLVAAKANEVVVTPQEVVLEPDDHNLNALMEQQQRYSELVVEARLLQGEFDALGAVPNVVAAALEEDDDKYDQYRAEMETRGKAQTQRAMLVQQFKAIQVSPYTADQLDAFEAQNKAYSRWFDKQALLAVGIDYHCEKCGHNGNMHDPRVETEYADVPEQEQKQSPLSDAQIASQRAILARYPERQELERKVFETDEFLSLNPDRSERIKAIETARRAVAAQQEGIQKLRRHTELTAKRADLGNRLSANPTCQADIDRILQKRQAVALYQQTLAQAQARQAEIEAAKAELAKFPSVLDSTIVALEKARSESLVYETQQAAYEIEKQKYDQEMAQQQVLQDELEDWSKGKAAISDLRTRVKAYLLPSLNKVASYLLHEFTGGVMQWLVINDDFEVIVDGKRVETLSGGGKTAANLAIRIGLGQVLTNQVFPVLMLDEPDESCDENRAAAIEKTLLVLREKMKQIVLVTHKTGRGADRLIHFS